MKSFENYLEDAKWQPINDYYKTFPAKLDENIQKTKELTSKQRKVFRKSLEDNFEIKKQNFEVQKELKKDLFNANVVGIDGTCSSYDFICGMQAVIGIVAVNYKNEKATYSTYVSEPFVEEETIDFMDQIKYLKNKGAGKVGLTESHIRAIMLWKERDFVLNRKEKYKMVQGDIMPYEMRYGQGKLRGLDTCLNLSRKLFEESNIVAVQTTTSRPDLRWYGTVLESGEYIQVYNYEKELESFLLGDPDVGKSPAHFNDTDKKSFLSFIQDIKGKYVVGLYKLKERAYVFYAPKNNFDLLANLVFADSQYQPLRGFPLLLDYADIMCSKLIPAHDIQRIVDSKLARKSMYEVDVYERDLRRR